jgi:hypothetical protein
MVLDRLESRRPTLDCGTRVFLTVHSTELEPGDWYARVGIISVPEETCITRGNGHSVPSERPRTPARSPSPAVSPKQKGRLAAALPGSEVQ